MGYDRESIIRKLKKLHAKAQSAEAIGSEAEAQTFAEAVQRMLSEYKVEAAEIQEQDGKDANPIVRVQPDWDKHKIKYRRREVEWMKELAAVVAWGHYCRISFVPKSSLVFFIGHEADAETAAEVFGKLANVAESMADKEYVRYFYECKRAGNVRLARGFRESFLRGFVHRLRDRYWSHMKAIEEYYAHDKKALTILGTARRKVDEFVEKNVQKDTREKKVARIANREGFFRGQDKAQELPLTASKEIG